MGSTNSSNSLDKYFTKLSALNAVLACSCDLRA